MLNVMGGEHKESFFWCEKNKSQWHTVDFVDVAEKGKKFKNKNSERATVILVPRLIRLTNKHSMWPTRCDRKIERCDKND